MKYIKNLLIITITFILLSLIVSLVMGFTSSGLPLLIERTIKSYKLCISVIYFCKFLPAILATAFLMGWAFDFGENYQGSRERFSPSMLNRYKFLLLSALCLVFILTIFSEIVVPEANRKMKTYEEMPRLEDEYKRYARNLYETERYELAREFAHLAVEIDPSDKDAVEIMDKAHIAAKKIETVRSKNSNIDLTEILPSRIDLTVISEDIKIKNTYSEPYIYYLKAEECYKNKDYFNAHYFAQQALTLTNPKDVNYSKMKDIAALSWNEISKTRFSGTSQEQEIFAKKFEGYCALLENDNLHAYYVFKHLNDSEKRLSLDPDVERYLEIAQERLTKQYFFTDETINLQNFENAQNICFKIPHPDQTTDIYFIKGITATGKKANLTQYLRGLSIYTIDQEGNYLSGSYTPYAKLKEISTSIFDDYAKKQLNISENLKTVPYIILNSVDRQQEGKINSAIPVKGQNRFTEGYIILPMEFNDLFILKEVSKGISNMNLSSSFKFLQMAEKYGYAKETYLISIFNRLLYPLFLLICFILLGIGSWHGRLPPNSIFKFKWIIVFPIFILIDYLLYQFFYFGFKQLNCSIMGLAGVDYSILLGSIIYAMIFVTVSVVFCACKNSMNQMS
ncbi:MAG: hypothetical protein K6E78_04985 [Treponema sp.]|nr:hypothetical protein [Treponema sp.]